jgi:hypothetical protein
MKASKILLWILGGLIVVGLIIGGAVYFSNNDPGNGDQNGEQSNNGQNVEINGEEQINIDTSDWQTYRNEEYGFSLRHPGSWKIHKETDHPTSVMFNVYKPADDIKDPPYDHHSSNVTHVSVYPQGIPTEGIFGESVASEVDFGVEVVEPVDYTLSDGTPFATKANFSSYPSNWNDSGFIFANTPISGLGVECERDSEIVSEDECDVAMGDTPIRHGDINEIDRAVEEAILESFEFIETDDNKEELIKIFEPEEGEVVSSPINISGEARGNWYFEADFPVRMEDADGNVLGEHYATAQGEWMTDDLVEFESKFSFEEPETATGTLILEKANPSGLEENEDEKRVMVRFNDE